MAQSGISNSCSNSLYSIYNKLETGGPYGDIRWNGKTKFTFPEQEDNFIVDDIRSNIVTKDYQGVLRNTGKYTSMTSNIRMIRIEEMYLNYIEASLKNATNANAGTALEYLNEIVSKRVEVKDVNKPNQQAVARNYTTLTMDVLKAERTRELMFEGFGYEDLMRWEGEVTNPKIKGNINLEKKVITYGDALTAFPIPQKEINVSKIEQNIGYR